MNIYEAIADIMKEGYAISKSKRNQQQGFMYRGIDDVMNTFQPLMAERGIFLVPEVLDATREERQTNKGGMLLYSVLRVKYTFYASDGTSISATVVGEGMDSGDKASNKAMAVAMKYAMFQVFCIPTEEMQDPDAETPPPSKPKPTAGGKIGKGEPNADGAFDTLRQALDIIKRDGDNEYFICPNCGKPNHAFSKKDGSVMTPREMLEMSMRDFGKPLCKDCYKKALGK